MEQCSSQGLCELLDNCSYLNWKNPRVTGITLAGINLYFLLTVTTNMNVVVIMTYMLLFYVVSGIVVAQFMDKVEKDDNEYEHVSKDTIGNFLKVVYSSLNAGDKLMRRVTSLNDVGYSIRFFAGIYLFMILSGYLSDIFILWLAINLFIIWKPVVTSQKNLIEKYTGQVIGYYEKTTKTVDSFIPRYKDQVKKDK